MDIAFFNGSKVGGYEKDGFWQTDRIYSIDSIINNNQTAAIAVRVLDTQGGGGIYGKPETMALTLIESGEKILLEQSARFLSLAEKK